MFFFVITKNLNWEILTKKERHGMGLRMKNFNIMSRKTQGGITWKGDLVQFADLRGWLAEKEGGWYPNAHYDFALNLQKMQCLWRLL